MHGHLNVKIFKSIYNFKIKLSVNKNFGNTCMVLILKKKLITDNTTIAVLITQNNINVNGIP